MPSRQVKKNWRDSQREKAILKRKKKKEKEQSEKVSKSPRSKHLDLRVALALDEIFGTLLGKTTVSAMSKLKQVEGKLLSSNVTSLDKWTEWVFLSHSLRMTWRFATAKMSPKTWVRPSGKWLWACQ